MHHILVLSPDPKAAETIASCFPDSPVERAAGLGPAEGRISWNCDLVFGDIAVLAAPAPSGGTGLAHVQRQTGGQAEVVVLAPADRVREAVHLVKEGAGTYLTYPVDPEELRLVVDSLLQFKLTQSELNYLRDSFWSPDAADLVRTKNPLMMKVYEKVRQAAPTKTTILITGESGTGKGVLARLIHAHSTRKNQQFISVHCGAIPDTLIESELFGHEKGAFTGALKRKLGKFEIAGGGTIFLDEVATLTPPAQVKLLQVIQDKTFQRLGGEATISTDARIVAATNSDLKRLCDRGEFRPDLYWRLNVFPIELPPLRERLEDIPLLAEVFLKRLNLLYGQRVTGLHPLVLEAFSAYPWPGNIREMENLIERAFILEQSNVLTPESFPADLFEQEGGVAPLPLDTDLPLAEVRARAVEQVERGYLKEVLARHRGRVGRAAENAGITSRQLHKLMRRYGLRKEDFKAPSPGRN